MGRRDLAAKDQLDPAAASGADLGEVHDGCGVGHARRLADPKALKAYLSNREGGSGNAAAPASSQARQGV